MWIDPLSLPQDLSREAILRRDGTVPSEWFHLPEVPPPPFLLSYLFQSVLYMSLGMCALGMCALGMRAVRYGAGCGASPLGPSSSSSATQLYEPWEHEVLCEALLCVLTNAKSLRGRASLLDNTGGYGYHEAHI